ncbi:Neuropeptide FF receptor 2-like protein [Leptotrombidium deliense]|uniref:Neuropeptide FF receptor 2-like protein n=1 Tax=Leptotrombidium deliense TaxID=299467 RepID=A0A443RWP9_9ACAR|nr:Neuropeptide FF receptor 2-like protein [Leptotrombidium deliense]
MIGNQSETFRKNFQRKKMKLVKMLNVIVFAYTALWTPFFINLWYMNIIGLWFTHVQSKTTNSLLFCFWLSCFTSCMNPIIYFWYYKKFRQDFKKLWGDNTLFTGSDGKNNINTANFS